MKKLLLLFMSLTVLTACNSDDDASEEDRILGTWFIVEVNNVPNSDFTLSECNKNSTMTFNGDGTATSVFHAQVEGNCMAGQPTNSTWNNQSGIYTITIPIPELEGFNTFTGTIAFTSNTFIFTPVLFPSTTLVFERD
ncbi:lipocalin family protein [Gillisia sp. Q332]|uniref:lipocalin family protein n=1 Tax=Gillisia xinjiangensis TaxID=3384765 RepID=UPI003918B21C